MFGIAGNNGVVVLAFMVTIPVPLINKRFGAGVDQIVGYPSAEKPSGFLIDRGLCLGREDAQSPASAMMVVRPWHLCRLICTNCRA